MPETIQDFHQLPRDEVENEGSGILSLDLTALNNESKKVSLPQQVEIHAGDVGAGHNPLHLQLSHGTPGDGHSEEPPTFTLGHNHVEELPQNLPDKDLLHVGHNQAGDSEVERNLPQDELVAEHQQGSPLSTNEQGPLPIGHEKGPLLPEQDHPGDFSHHENDIDDPFTHIKLHRQCPCIDQHNIGQSLPSHDDNHEEQCEPCDGHVSGYGNNAHGLLEHTQWNHHTQRKFSMFDGHTQA